MSAAPDTAAPSGPAERAAQAWLRLPGAMRARLLLGSVGGPHLLDVVDQGLCAAAELGGPDQLSALHACADVALTAWGDSPLDGGMAGRILCTPALYAALAPEQQAALKFLAERWALPEEGSYFHRLAQRREPEKLARFLDAQIGKEPDNFFWRHQALALALFEGDGERAERALDFEASQEMLPVAAAALARIRELTGDPAEAARLYLATKDFFGPGYRVARSGPALLRAGDRDGAILALRKAAAYGPWRVSERLVLHDLTQGVDAETAPLPGSLAVLLYSWNKAAELDATLSALHASDLTFAADVKLFVLDNGGADETPAVVKRWAEAFGTERFETITLPTNVGAPAARNWLMRLPGVMKRDFALYLDDDAEVPADWLGRFGALVGRYPDAGAWGCKVVDHAASRIVQSADLHLMFPRGMDPARPDLDLSATDPNPFRLSDLHVLGLDTGLFDHARPCASVTGCCHLFRTATLLDNGGFSLYLSPSQYDDMEHDLRLCKARKFPAYSGHLVVRHKKRTGAASRVSRSEEMSALGNKYKMQVLHDRAEIEASLAAERELLEADLLAKIRR